MGVALSGARDVAAHSGELERTFVFLFFFFFPLAEAPEAPGNGPWRECTGNGLEQPTGARLHGPRTCEQTSFVPAMSYEIDSFASRRIRDGGWC